MRPMQFQKMLSEFHQRCNQRNGLALSEHEHYAAVAHFLGVDLRTLRRYRTGHKPIPRMVEIIAVIMRHNPTMTVAAIEGWLAQERRGQVVRSADKMSAHPH